MSNLEEVSFQIDAEKLSAAIRRMDELVRGSMEETELEPLLLALDTALRFEVEEGCKEVKPACTCGVDDVPLHEHHGRKCCGGSMCCPNAEE